MAENKTKATTASVEQYLAAIEDPVRRADCEALSRLMAKASKQPAVMWGTGIVGFGSYHYVYESGREGDSCLTGFAARKGDISLYLTAEVLAQKEQIAKLGKVKISKGCLYVRKLADVDLKILAQLVADTCAERKKRYG
jgi:hypothetical protein